MIIGIVGSEQAKFTPASEKKARNLIVGLLKAPGVTGVASGHCHLGGVDIYAEEIGTVLGLKLHIFPPRSFDWSGGYKPRNIQIADISASVFCITVDKYPPDYKGMRFSHCYHCGTDNHIKSGGCWTVKYARNKGKYGDVLVISQE